MQINTIKIYIFRKPPNQVMGVHVPPRDPGGVWVGEPPWRNQDRAHYLHGPMPGSGLPARPEVLLPSHTRGR